MNLKHHLFISEMLKHGNSEQAYKAVYPKAEGKAAQSAANRLLSRPEVADAISEATKRIRAEAEQEFRKRIDEELFNQLEMKQTLTKIARCSFETEKTYKKNGGYETVPVKPSISNVLRAMDMYSRLEGWYVKNKPATKKEAKPEKEAWVPPPPEDTWPNNCEVYGPNRWTFYKDDTDYIYQRWDPDDSNTVEQFAAYLASRARRMGIESIPEREIHKLPKDWKTCHKINPGKWDTIYYEKLELPKEKPAEVTEQSAVSAKLAQVYASMNNSKPLHTPEYSNEKYGSFDVKPEKQAEEKPIMKLLNELHESFMRKQTPEAWKKYLTLSKLYHARTKFPNQLPALEKETGWAFVPGDELIVRRCA